MVSTRRATANAAPTTTVNINMETCETRDNIICIAKPLSNKTKTMPLTPKLLNIPLDTIPSDSISVHDLSLTSPYTSESIATANMNSHKQQLIPLSSTDFKLPVIPQKLAPKPRAATGSARNPILMIEDSPPGPRTYVANPPMHKNQRQPEPHKFIDRGYRKLYSYRQSRPALAPKPADGNTFTGHQSHDIYRMMSAKAVAVDDSVWRPQVPSGIASHSVPFEVQYPMSAQFLARQNAANMALPVNAQYYGQQVLMYQPSVVPSHVEESEEVLRKKALQYVRECSRPKPRKRRLSDADPDETSASESEQLIADFQSPASHPSSRVGIPSSASRSAPDNFHRTKKPSVFRDNDTGFNIELLTEHTSLLTSLLSAYPASIDKKGLREDIAMLVSVQNQRLVEWTKLESDASRKRQKSNTASSTSSSKPVENHRVLKQQPANAVARRMRAAEQQKGKDNEVRWYLSANANMWQDGSGRGVADEFAIVPSSPSAASAGDRLPSIRSLVPGLGGRVQSVHGEEKSLGGKQRSTIRNVCSRAADVV